MAASTGSPASRRSTNFTPLTTRPSLTSRQGMTRTLNMPRWYYAGSPRAIRSWAPPEGPVAGGMHAGPAAALFQRVLYGREGGLELRSEIGNHRDDRDRNPGGDQSILDGRRSGLVIEKSLAESFH